MFCKAFVDIYLSNVKERTRSIFLMSKDPLNVCLSEHGAALFDMQTLEFLKGGLVSQACF